MLMLTTSPRPDYEGYYTYKPFWAGENQPDTEVCVYKKMVPIGNNEYKEDLVFDLYEYTHIVCMTDPDRWVNTYH